MAQVLRHLPFYSIPRVLAMPISRPYFRVCRPFVSGDYINSISSTYLSDPRNAGDLINLVRGYHLLEKQLYRIFDYVEPADANLHCFSHELYALLLRASTEFEANARAILSVNGYVSSGNLTMRDYHKLNVATRLSEYYVTVPIWNGSRKRFAPLNDWSHGPSLTWYQDYNSAKHDRSANFAKASMRNAIDAVASVFCILFSQFHIFAFDPNHPVSGYSIDDAGNHWSHDACLLTIETPTTWKEEQKYDFDWDLLKTDAQAFNKYSF